MERLVFAVLVVVLAGCSSAVAEGPSTGSTGVASDSGVESKGIRVPPASMQEITWDSPLPQLCFAPLPATVDAASALDPPPDAMAAVAAYGDGQSGVWAVASEVDGRVAVAAVLSEVSGGGLVDEPLGHSQTAEPWGMCDGRELGSCSAQWDAAEAAARACLEGL